jgi:penicillin amidase
VVPAQNFVYADRSGNIGYQLAGRIPMRTYESGLIPQSGNYSDDRWSGWIPFEKLPRQFNPSKGFIITANNNMVENSPYYFSALWEPPYRAIRIGELIQSKSILSRDDMAMIQYDQLNILARETVSLLLRELADSHFDDTYTESIKVLLSNWDYKMETESIAAAFFEVWIYHLIHHIFEDEMGPEYFRLFTDLPNFYIRIFIQILTIEESSWFDNIRTEAVEERADMIRQSFEQAIETLQMSCGSALENWRWGEVHQLEFAHVLGRISLTNILFNRGPMAVGGNPVTINVATYSYANPFQMIAGPSLRFLIDWSEPSIYRSVIPGGNSGNFLSEYYDNQISLWLRGGYKEVNLLVPSAAGEVILIPAEK